MTDIRQVAIRYRLGLENAESLLRAADSLLAEGHTEPAVIELAILDSPTMTEAGPLFERVCYELDVIIPTKDGAIDELLRCYLEAIATGKIPAFDGLSAMMREICFPYFEGDRCKRYVGDSRGMEQLSGDFWAYEDLTDRSRECSWDGKYGAEAIASWEQSVRQDARDWLAKHNHLPRE